MGMSYFQLSDSTAGSMGHLLAQPGPSEPQDLVCLFVLPSVLLASCDLEPIQAVCHFSPFGI